MDRGNSAWTRTTAALGLGAVALLTMAACGTAPHRSAAPPEATVTIQSFAFVPARLAVNPGTEVTWTNQDKILHTVTTGTPGEQGIPGVSEDTPARADGLLDRKLDGEGSTVSFRFQDPGTYTYYCAIHSGMTGAVVVR